jgi:hypothetical protein
MRKPSSEYCGKHQRFSGREQPESQPQQSNAPFTVEQPQPQPQPQTVPPAQAQTQPQPTTSTGVSGVLSDQELLAVDVSVIEDVAILRRIIAVQRESITEYDVLYNKQVKINQELKRVAVDTHSDANLSRQ